MKTVVMHSTISTILVFGQLQHVDPWSGLQKALQFCTIILQLSKQKL
jgi:hypothetical protein